LTLTQAGRLAGWQAGRQAGWQAGRQAGRLAGWQAGGMGVNQVLCQIALNVQDICFFNQYQ
jgi:predicted transposase YdaD